MMPRRPTGPARVEALADEARDAPAHRQNDPRLDPERDGTADDGSCRPGPWQRLGPDVFVDPPVGDQHRGADGELDDDGHGMKQQLGGAAHEHGGGRGEDERGSQ